MTLRHLPIFFSLALAACGGASGPPAQASVPGSTSSQIQDEQQDEAKSLPDDAARTEDGSLPAMMPARSAVRFLNQASFGATDAEAAGLQRQWRWGWMQQQFELPVGLTHWDRVKATQAAFLAEDGARTESDLKKSALGLDDLADLPHRARPAAQTPRLHVVADPRHLDGGLLLRGQVQPAHCRRLPGRARAPRLRQLP